MISNGTSRKELAMQQSIQLYRHTYRDKEREREREM